jgi:hypothetical protein
MNFKLFSMPVIAATLTVAGCHRQEVRVALQPREKPFEPADRGDSEPEPARPRPRFTWKLPVGWTETGAGQMSVASFQIKAEGGEATVNITPLPNLAGKEALIVNMWREQVGATPLSEEDSVKALSEVEIAGGKGKLFEISGSSGGKPTKIITAIAQASNASWFYKLSGDEAVVAAQKPAFLEFLKSVHMEEAVPDSSAAGEHAQRS